MYTQLVYANSMAKGYHIVASGKTEGPTRNRTGVARMSYITEVMSIRTGSDNRYTIEP